MANKVQITRHEEFEASHILTGYDGGCGRLHGHSYRIEVTVEGPQHEPFGMVMDFQDLKRAIKLVIPDHYFMYTENDPVGMDIAVTLRRHAISSIAYPFVTTAENLAPYFAKEIEGIIQNRLGYADVQVVRVDLWETTNSHATYIRNRDRLEEGK